MRVEPSVEVFWYAAPLAAEASAGGPLKKVCVVGGSRPLPKAIKTRNPYHDDVSRIIRV